MRPGEPLAASGGFTGSRVLDVALSPNTLAAERTTGAIRGGHRSCHQHLPSRPFPSGWQVGMQGSLRLGHTITLMYVCMYYGKIHIT